MTLATCPCGKKFERDQPWKKTCLPCWQESKRKEKSSGADAELLKARIKVYELTAELAELRLQSNRAKMIEPGMLARLIRLCHPDKHGNNEASNTATAWLLEQRA